MLCAGIWLAQVDEGLPERRQREARREAVMRLERLWGLANALAAERNQWSARGLRGPHLHCP